MQNQMPIMEDKNSEITSLTEEQLDQVEGGCKGAASPVLNYEEHDLRTGSKRGSVSASFEMGANQC